MAIFSKVDSALPLITQLMQVNLDDEEELLRFWRRTFGLSQLDTLRTVYESEFIQNKLRENKLMKNRFRAKAEWEHVIQKETEFVKHLGLDAGPGYDSRSPSLLIRAQAAGYKTERDYLLAQFKEVCCLAITVFTSIYQSGMVPFKTLTQLRQYSKEKSQLMPSRDPHEQHEELHFPKNFAGRIIENEMFVPLQKLEYRTEVDDSETYYLARQTDVELVKLVHGQARLLRCAECTNIFILYQGVEVYCSARCNSRARQRRYRRKKTLQEN